MKVLHLCLTGPYTDGLSYQENMLTKFQKKDGLDVVIFASQWYWGADGNVKFTDKTDYFNGDEVRVYRLPIKNSSKNVYFRYKRYSGFEYLLEKTKPDIIFVHNLQFFDILKLIPYKKKNPKIKIFVDNHCDFSNSARTKLAKIFYKIVWKNIALKINPYVEKFWGVLPVRVKFLTDVYGLPKSKCHLLVMGGDDECIKKAKIESQNIRTIYNVSKTDFLIVTGGKIDSYKKETLNLMKAVREINKQKVIKRNLKLIVFGSVSNELKRDFRSCLDAENIFYAGWLNEQEGYSYFAASDLVIFPGRHSVYWEQVVSIGKPIVCRYWNGVNHVDIGGNVSFLYETSTPYIIKSILNTIVEDYDSMKKIAKNSDKCRFLYSNISLKSIK